MATSGDYEREWLDAMRPYWHVVARSIDVAQGAVVPVKLLGERLALWRADDGSLAIVDERCPHRGVALSLGDVTDDGCVRCPYHSWTFDPSGTWIVQSQLPKGLPVDVTSELHLPHDRFAIAFRRALADLGVPVPVDGTARPEVAVAHA